MTDAQPAAVRTSMAWYVRVPLKLGVFLLVLLFVLFPDPRLLVRQLGRIQNLDKMIDGQHPEIQKMAAQFKRLRDANQLPPALPAARAARQPAKKHAGSATSKPTSSPATTQPRDVQFAVERFVYDRMQYDWDWVLWGVADYIPTVDEMFDAAWARPGGRLREDCDGHAVIAASLLRALGYDSHLVTDLRHVWVRTPQGDIMGAGGETTIVSTAKGNRVKLGGSLGNILLALSFGVSVFPFWREFVIWAALVLLSLHPRMSPRAALLGAILTLQGWLFIRCGVISKPDFRWLDQAWPGCVGLLHVALGLGVLWIASHRARRASRRPANPEKCPA